MAHKPDDTLTKKPGLQTIQYFIYSESFVQVRQLGIHAWQELNESTVERSFFER